MSIKTILKMITVVSVATFLGFVSWGVFEDETANENVTEVASTKEEVKGATSNIKTMTKEEMENVPFEKVEKEKIKIPTDLKAKNVKHVKNLIGKSAQKRPGGYLITSYYETDIGEGQLIVSQSVNEFGDANLQIEDVKKWYSHRETGSTDFSINGMHAVLHENKSNFNTLHVITDTEIYTFAGQASDYLIEVAEFTLNNVK